MYLEPYNVCKQRLSLPHRIITLQLCILNPVSVVSCLPEGAKSPFDTDSSLFSSLSPVFLVFSSDKPYHGETFSCFYYNHISVSPCTSPYTVTIILELVYKATDLSSVKL